VILDPLYTTHSYFSPDPGAIDPTTIVGPHNSFAMSTAQFIPHLFKELDRLGLTPSTRTNFVSAQLPNFFTHRNIAYRFMSPSRLAQAIDLSVTCSPCIWTRLFLLYRGISDEEVTAFGGATEKDVPEDHWRNVIGVSDQSQNKDLFRIFETSVLEIT